MEEKEVILTEEEKINEEKMFEEMRRRNHQFQDFRLYIRLLIVELKILVLPTLDTALARACSRRGSTFRRRRSGRESERESSFARESCNDESRGSESERIFGPRESLSEDSYLARARNDSINPFEDHDHTVDRKGKI